MTASYRPEPFGSWPAAVVISGWFGLETLMGLGRESLALFTGIRICDQSCCLELVFPVIHPG